MRIAVFAALLVAAAAVEVRLDFKKDQRYTYTYDGVVANAIPRGANNILGLRLKCQCHMDGIAKTALRLTLENIQLHEVIGEKQEQQYQPLSKDIVDAIKIQLEKPIRVKLGDGLVKQIEAKSDDPEWSLNMKRGIVNMLQVAPEPQEQTLIKQIERTFVGVCQVAYNIWPKTSVTKVTKVINYDKCRYRPQLKQSMILGQLCDKCQKSIGYAPYLRSVGQIEYELETIPEGTIIKRAWGNENHVLTPFSEQGGHASARARQTLTFKEVKPINVASDADLTKKTSLLFVSENPDERYLNDVEYQKYLLTEIMKNLALIPEHVKEETVSQKSAEIVSTIVRNLRQCNKQTVLLVLGKVVGHPDVKTRRIALDALSLVGTKQAFEALKEDSLKLTKEDMSRVLLGLPLAQQASKDHVDIVWKLCEMDHVAKDVTLRRHCMLGFGALVRKIRQNPSLLQDTKVRLSLEEYYKNIRMGLTDAKTDDKKLTFIKTIGNSGEISFITDLLKIVRDTKEMEMIRVECIWAMRHIVKDQPEKVAPRLYPLFANATESPELRMAIFVTLLDLNPTLLNMQTLVNIVARELRAPSPAPRSNQLASFVMSHLSALAFHNNVITKQRSMFARLVLRQMPRVNFDLSYSKGMRLALYSGKFQAGQEWEFNKMNVPDSFLPRSMNAKLQLHLLGYRFNAIEFGARMEGVHDIIAQLISEIRSRQKRSLWSSIASWFEDYEESATKTTTFRATKATSRPTTFVPLSNEPTETPQPWKAQQISVFMKLFGDELKFVHFKQQDIQQLVQDIRDLMTGKKQEIKYPNMGIVINRNGIDISNQLTKAFLAADARQMVPTLVGVPLDLKLHASFVARMKVQCSLRTGSSIFNFFKMNTMKGNVQVMPSTAVFVHGMMGLHTPFVRAGVQMKSYIHSESAHKIDLDMKFGEKYEMKYQHPQRKTDLFTINSDVQGYVQTVTPKTYTHVLNAVDMKIDRQHLVQVAPQCKPINLLGVNMCYKAEVPDMASLRFAQIPIFPTIGLSKLGLTVDRAQDKPEHIVINFKSIKWQENEMKCDAEISASSSEVKRVTPINVKYVCDTKELTVEVSKIQAPTYKGDEVCKLTTKFTELKKWEALLAFGRGKMYEIGFQTAIEDMGRRIRLQVQWNKLPQEWKDWVHFYEPQIYWLLQQFAWIRRPEASEKKLVIVFQLRTPFTADLRIQSPNTIAKRTDLPLPITINRFPQTVAEIKSYFYSTCEVKSESIKAFDQIKYQNKLKDICYVLARDQVKGKEPRFHVSLKSSSPEQQTVILQLTKLNVKVEIQNQQKVLINGKECQKQCTQQGVTVRKEQVEGKNRITVSTPHGMHIITDGQQLRLQASPMLRNRVRGLCGDADGEQWNDFRTPQNQVLSRERVEEFIKSWETKC